jgi:hypothetical protein
VHACTVFFSPFLSPLTAPKFYGVCDEAIF